MVEIIAAFTLSGIFVGLYALGQIENETRKNDKDNEPFIRG